MSRSNSKRARKPRRAIPLVLASMAIFAAVANRAEYSFGQPSAANEASSKRNAAARQWFEDAKFGLSIDWGIDSLLGKGHRVMDTDRLAIREYAKLLTRFNPTHFDAESWVKLAKESGARYITISAKHHDGFCMFASRLTDYDIVDATPYHVDPLKALADACHKQKIKLFLDYSLLDWHHPDYFPLGKTGKAAGREPNGDWKRYVAYYQGQVRELCTNYGEIGGILFDGLWDRPDADWDLAGTYRMIQELQPGALLGNDDDAQDDDKDLQTAEAELLPSAVGRWNKRGGGIELPRETRLTINDSTGYNPYDRNFKSAEQIIRALVGAAGRGVNLRLTISAGPDGTIVPEVGQRLLEVGKWLEAYGDSIYGTRQGPFPPQPWGVLTSRDSGDRLEKIYIHILKPKDLQPIRFDRLHAWKPFMFGSTTPLKLIEAPQALVLDIPKDALTPIDTIIVLRPK